MCLCNSCITKPDYIFFFVLDIVRFLRLRSADSTPGHSVHVAFNVYLSGSLNLLGQLPLTSSAQPLQRGDAKWAAEDENRFWLKQPSVPRLRPF